MMDIGGNENRDKKYRLLLSSPRDRNDRLLWSHSSLRSRDCREPFLYTEPSFPRSDFYGRGGTTCPEYSGTKESFNEKSFIQFYNRTIWQ